jgi:hypothetical protein
MMTELVSEILGFGPFCFSLVFFYQVVQSLVKMSTPTYSNLSPSLEYYYYSLFYLFLHA